MALNFNPFEGDKSIKAPVTKKKLTKLKPWESPVTEQPANPPIDKPEQAALVSTPDHVETTNPPSVSPAIQETKDQTPYESPTVVSTPVDLHAVHSSVVDSTAVDSTPVESPVVDSPTVESTPVEITPVEATTVKQTTVHSTPDDSTLDDLTLDESTTVDSPVVDLTTDTRYFPIPNAIMDRLCSDMELTLRELRLMLFLVRRTLGWHRIFDGIKAEEFQRALSFDNSTVWKTIKSLEGRGYIIRRGTGGKTCNEYALNGDLFGPLIVGKSPRVKSPRVKSTVDDSTTVNRGQFAQGSPYIKEKEEKTKPPVGPSDTTALLKFCLDKMKNRALETDEKYIKRGGGICKDLAHEHGREKGQTILARFFSDESEWVKARKWSWSAFESRRHEYLTDRAASEKKPNHSFAWKDAAGGES